MTIEEIGRITGFKDTQSNVEAGTGALAEIRFAQRTNDDILGFSLDNGGTWYWISAGSGDVIGNGSGTMGHMAVFDGDIHHIKDGGLPPTGTVGSSYHLIVTEQDNFPLVTGTVQLKFPNGSLTDNGSGVVSVEFTGVTGTTYNTVSRQMGTILYDSGALGGAAAFDTSTISCVGFDYLTVEILEARATAAISNGDMRLSFNADTTGTNYSSTSGGSTSYNNANCQNIGNVTGGNATANLVTTYSIKIGTPTGSNKKTAYGQGYEPESTSTANNRQYSVVWHSTAAITRIQIDVNNATATFAAGSRLLVIGWKAENVKVP